MSPAPVLRQVVLLSSDLAATLGSVRGFLGLNAGVREVRAMAELGFEHEVLAVDQTFLEIVAPLTPQSSPGRLLAKNGESGYMVVVQVADLQAVLERGTELGLTPVMHAEIDGNPISQWHPRDLGTLAEIDEIQDGRSWHFCPALSDTGSTAVVRDLVAVDIAVADPVAMAQRWGTLLGTSIAPGAAEVELANGLLRFLPSGESARGLVRAEFAPAAPEDPPPVSELNICGIRLVILEQETP